MKEFLDYDPFTGLATYTEDIDDNRITVHQEEDVAGLLDHLKEKRNTRSGDYSIAGHMNHYAEIPQTVAVELMRKGINVYNLRGKEEFDRLAREIETNYPMLKVTDKKAWRPKATKA